MPPKKGGDRIKPHPIIGRFGTSLKIGIVGLPNVGKSTFFNVLTKSQAAAENFPFCTIDPNKSRVPVPDNRFDFLCQYHKPASKIPAFLNVVDIAGLVKGVHAGQGLGNAFLSHISTCDGIFHLMRSFEDDNITHIEGSVDPVRDIEIIHEELRLKDEKMIMPIIDRLEKVAVGGGDKKLKPEYDIMCKIKTWVIDEKKPVCFYHDWNDKEIEVLNKHLFLTSKPMIYLVNLSEKDYIRKKNKWLIKIKEWVDKHDPGALVIPFSGALELKLQEMSAEEKEKYLKENMTQSALPKIIKAGYAALQLEYFFTAGPDEVRAWTIRKGTTAPQAAGKIHTDFEKGFIMAEVMKYEDFKEEGSENAVKAAGKYRQQGPSFVNEDQPAPKAAVLSKDAPKGASRTTAQAANIVTTPRRSLLPAPKPASTPAGSKKEVQKDQEANKPVVSSPKRLAASTTKLHSPGHPKQRAAVPRNGFANKPDLQAREAERQFVQRLKEKCEEQSKQLSYIQGELKRAIRGFEVFAVSTQHFFGKNENALVKEKELSIELANIRDEVAFNTAKCEKLQKEKEDLERRFEDEVKRLRWQQQAELQDLEERLQEQYVGEVKRLQEEHRMQLVRLKCQHQEQVEDISATHEAALLEMENNHSVAIAVLQDDHEHKVQELMSAHELEKKELEDSFEKLRLSLQDQVDTLTFQSHSLRDRAKRFEEALRRNTEEQLEVALAPYQHLEEDMNSLKQVLEMKNQQIHQQEKKIIELEKLAEKNIILEEKIQVLQQQNEDLKARIDQNTVVTRQLSEENANLQEYVEKETKEKKRLSRTNEELLWKLQTGDPTSPIKLSPTSPIYRSSSGPPSPAKISTAPR